MRFVLRYTADATTPIDKALQDGAAAMDTCAPTPRSWKLTRSRSPPLAFLPVGIWLLRWAHWLPKAQRPNALVLGYAATLGAMWTVAGRQEPDLHALVRR